MIIWYRPVRPGKKRGKMLAARIIFILLGRAFQSASIHDPGIRREIASWDEGLTLILKVLPNGPVLGFEKREDRLICRRGKLREADLEFHFRNIESALMVLAPRMGIHQAFAEHRIIVKGDLGKAMAFNRTLSSLLTILYPRFIVRRLVKRVPPGLTARMIGLRIWLFTLGILLGK